MVKVININNLSLLKVPDMAHEVLIMVTWHHNVDPFKDSVMKIFSMYLPCTFSLA